MPESADDVIEVFNVAADENRLSPLRKQQVVELPQEGELWVAGDIHDNRTNFNKILHHVRSGQTILIAIWSSRN